MADASLPKTRPAPGMGWAAVLRPIAAVTGREPRGLRVTARSGRSAARGPVAGGGGSPGLHGAKRRKTGDTRRVAEGERSDGLVGEGTASPCSSLTSLTLRSGNCSSLCRFVVYEYVFLQCRKLGFHYGFSCLLVHKWYCASPQFLLFSPVPQKIGSRKRRSLGGGCPSAARVL